MKIKKILFTMLLICCSFMIVNAEESDIFKYDWTKKYLYEESEQLYYHNKAYYDDGYIITDIDLDFNYETDAPEKVTTKIVQYDSKGEVVKEKEISGIVITYLEVHDNEFYAIGYKENGNNENFIGFVAKMNLDFEIEKEYLDDEEDLLEPDFYIYIKDIFHNLIAKKDNKVFVYCTSGVLILDSDFKIVDLKSFDDVTETEYLELFSFSYEKIQKIYDESYSVRSFDTKNNIEAFLISKDSKLYLRVYKDDKELYTKKLSSRLYDSNIQSFRIVNNYVLIMTMDEILVYDLNGDKVQTIYIEDALDAANIVENYVDYWFYNLVPGNNSFMYSICENQEKGTYCFTPTIDDSLSPDSLDNIKMNGGLITQYNTTKENNYRYKMHDQVWYLPINVITKTDGNGQVEAIDTARYGDEVTFKVTPNKGYVLESVKVTDSNGNVVVFTDYTFTMPSSDVTIEATFIKEENNPDTTDIAIIGCIIIIVTGVILTLLNFRKLKELE